MKTLVSNLKVHGSLGLLAATLCAFSCGESTQPGSMPGSDDAGGASETNRPPPQPPSTTPPKDAGAGAAITPPAGKPPVIDPSAMPGACATPGAVPALRLVTVAAAARPIHLVGHPSDPDVVLIAERGGTVRQARGLSTAMTAVELSPPILTVNTTTGSERGLLSLALHPDDRSKLYVFYNDGASNNDSVVQEFTRNLETGMATAGRELYRAPHSAGNHQGGNLGFGSDKMLYFSIGDNGSQAAAGNLANHYGKILRIDPATGMAPPGNHMGLIWSYGLRNPWRMSFDRKTGDLYIGDVGAGTEEVNFQAAGMVGINYGWSGGGVGAGAPIYRYPNGGGQNCVVGGYVYRGSKNACMYGRYFFKDRARANAQSLVVQNGAAQEPLTHAGLGGPDFYSFGEDGAGELYMLFGGGRIARIVE